MMKKLINWLIGLFKKDDSPKPLPTPPVEEKPEPAPKQPEKPPEPVEVEEPAPIYPAGKVCEICGSLGTTQPCEECIIESKTL